MVCTIKELVCTRKHVWENKDTKNLTSEKFHSELRAPPEPKIANIKSYTSLQQSRQWKEIPEIQAVKFWFEIESAIFKKHFKHKSTQTCEKNFIRQV